MSALCQTRWGVVCALFIERFNSSGIALSPRLGIDSLPIVDDDDRRNESVYYRELFSDECIGFVAELFDTTQSKVANGELESLRTLEFMQGVFARAIWSYGHALPSRLDGFTREFDRLDVESERARLFLHCKTHHASS